MNKWIIILLSILVFMFSSCSRGSDSNVIVSGTGTEAGEAYGIAQNLDGTPIALKQILIYKQLENNLDFALVDSVFTDSIGYFVFTGDPGDIYYLEYSQSDQVWNSTIELSEEKALELGAIEAKKSIVLSGWVWAIQTGIPDSVKIAGTPNSCVISKPDVGVADSLQIGFFECKNISADTIEVYIKNEFKGEFDLTNAKDSFSVDTLLYNSEMVLLENWMDTDRKFLLNYVFPNSNWHLVHDSLSTMEPVETNVLEYSISYDSVAEMGYLHTEYTFHDSANYVAWAQINIQLGNLNDFTTLDSLCLQVRGDASFHIRAIGIEEVDIDQEPIFYSADLTSDWTRHCVDFSSSNTEWDEISNDLKSFKFSKAGGTTMDIGKIELWGIELSK